MKEQKEQAKAWQDKGLVDPKIHEATGEYDVSKKGTHRLQVPYTPLYPVNNADFRCCLSLDRGINDLPSIHSGHPHSYPEVNESALKCIIQALLTDPTRKLFASSMGRRSER